MGITSRTLKRMIMIALIMLLFVSIIPSSFSTGENIVELTNVAVYILDESTGELYPAEKTGDKSYTIPQDAEFYVNFTATLIQGAVNDLKIQPGSTPVVSPPAQAYSYPVVGTSYNISTGPHHFGTTICPRNAAMAFIAIGGTAVLTHPEFTGYMALKYPEGSSGCIKIKVINFSWIPSFVEGTQYTPFNLSEGDMYGVNYTLENQGLTDITIDWGIMGTFFTQHGQVLIPAGDKATITTGPDVFTVVESIRNKGQLTMKDDATGEPIFPTAGSLNHFQFFHTNATRVDSQVYNIYPDRVGYLPGQEINLETVMRVYPVESRTKLVLPLYQGSILRVTVRDYTGGTVGPVLLEGEYPINPDKDVVPGDYFGTFEHYRDLSGDNYTSIGDISFIAGDPVPEQFIINMTLWDASGKRIFFIDTGEPNSGIEYKNRVIALTKSLPCYVSCNLDGTCDTIGCSCSFSRDDDRDYYDCTGLSSGTDPITGQQYYLYFIFKNNTGTHLNTETAAEEGAAIPDFYAEYDTIAFLSVPLTDSGNRSYSFIFLHDADGDGYDSEIFGGSDCNDNNFVVNPGQTEVGDKCFDGEDNDCDGDTDCADSVCAFNPGCIPASDCGLAVFDPALNSTSYTPRVSVPLSWSRQSSIFPVEYKLSYKRDGDDEWIPIRSVFNLYYDWDVTGFESGVYTVRLIPNDGNRDGTINTTRIFIGENGRINGTVKCDDEPVPGANVFVRDYSGTLVQTDSNGYYSITNAPIGRHSILASYSGRKTEQKEYDINDYDIYDTVNFTDVCPVRLDCEADCTLLGGDICRAECSGFTDEEGNVCSLNPLCVNVKKGLLIDDPTNSSRMLRCCEGEHVGVTEKATDVRLGEDIKAEDVIRITRIVYYEGKPVKMIILVWE